MRPRPVSLRSSCWPSLIRREPEISFAMSANLCAELRGASEMGACWVRLCRQEVGGSIPFGSTSLGAAAVGCLHARSAREVPSKRPNAVEDPGLTLLLGQRRKARFHRPQSSARPLRRAMLSVSAWSCGRSAKALRTNRSSAEDMRSATPGSKSTSTARSIISASKTRALSAISTGTPAGVSQRRTRCRSANARASGHRLHSRRARRR